MPPGWETRTRRCAGRRRTGCLHVGRSEVGIHSHHRQPNDPQPTGQESLGPSPGCPGCTAAQSSLRDPARCDRMLHGPTIRRCWRSDERHTGGCGYGTHRDRHHIGVAHGVSSLAMFERPAPCHDDQMPVIRIATPPCVHRRHGLHRPHHRPVRRRHHPSPTRSLHLDGHAIKLIDPSRGIRNPAMLPATLSIQTNPRSATPTRPDPTASPATASAPATGHTETTRKPTPYSNWKSRIIWLQTISPGRFISVAPGLPPVEADPANGNTHWPSATNCDRRSAPPHRWKPPTPNPSPDDACTSRHSVCASWTPTQTVAPSVRWAIRNCWTPRNITPTATSVVYRKSATVSLCKIHHWPLTQHRRIRLDYGFRCPRRCLRRSTADAAAWAAGLPRTQTAGSAAPAGRQALMSRDWWSGSQSSSGRGDGRKCD